MERITITIINWNKFNPRKDVKRPTWFAMSNDLLDHPDFADFSPVEFHTLVYIFSQASKRNSPDVDLVFAHAKVRNIEPALLMTVIRKLERIHCVRVTSEVPYAHVQNLYATDTTDRHDRQTEGAEHAHVQNLPAGKKRASRKPAGAVVPLGQNLVAAYCEAYRKRYPTNPVLKPQDGRQLKAFGEQVGEPKAKELIAAYLTMNNSWFITKVHDVGTLLNNLNQVQNYVATGQIVTKDDAHQAEVGDALKNQMARLTGGAS